MIMTPSLFIFSLSICSLACFGQESGLKGKYPISGTGQEKFYDQHGEIKKPMIDSPFSKQDAGTTTQKPSYRDNKDGTATDLVTGLTWEKSMGEKMTFKEAQLKVKEMNKGKFKDWRIPSIKELYSLILFSGQAHGERSIIKFIDTNYFDQPLGDKNKGEREIDAQTWSSTFYQDKVMSGQEGIFGVNFVDGRIKTYPLFKRGAENKMYFRMVRGNPDYGKNLFIDNGDGTVTDQATGLMWQKDDDGKTYDWPQALQYASDLKLAGYQDWRLPTAKELQSIIDYSRAPKSTHSAAIDPVFHVSQYVYDDVKDYPYYWTSTTHADGPRPGKHAVCICFGQGMGKGRGGGLIDVHGAGSQRSDPKSGNPSQYPEFKGPQQDMRRVFNTVRCVRTINK